MTNKTMSHPTPGPWRQGIKHPARIIGADDTIVGFTVQFTDDDDAPNEIERANARLIAKAPEMLEFLTTLATVRYREDGLIYCDPTEVAECARALLAEIGGENGPI